MGETLKFSDERQKPSSIRMLIAPYGRFLGKVVEEIVVGKQVIPTPDDGVMRVVNTYAMVLEDAVEIVNIQTQQGIQVVLVKVGTLTVPHIVSTMWAELDSKSPIYAEYYKATSGLTLR